MTSLAKPLKKIFTKICNSQNISDLVNFKGDFTRHYKLTFESVVLKILHSFQDSVEFNLSTFLPQLNIPVVTAGAFSIARYKLKIDLFHDLNRELNFLLETFPKKQWKGYRLFAGDGTTVNLPIHKSTIKEFGLFRESKKGGKTVMANACMLYDVLNNYVIDAKIAPFKDGEKTILKKLLENIYLSNILMILDRGFGNFYFIKLLINKNLDFCIRLRTTELLFAEKVLAFPKDDFIIDWFPSEEERSSCRKNKVDTNPIKVRVTKIVLPDGTVEVLVSSLLDVLEFTKEDINHLYQLRWGVEEGYKKLKPKMKLEQFGCKRQEGIYQEFYAHIFMMNLSQILCEIAQQNIEVRTSKRKYQYKYNWINAYKFILNSFVKLFKQDDIECIIDMITKQIEYSIIAIIPSRSFLRTTGSIRKHRMSQMYK